MIRQTRPGELVDILRTDFQHRNEPNFAWKSAVSAGLALPALRGFWPMSSVGYLAATQARDISGEGYHLANNNVADFGYDGLAPYVDLNGTTQYLSRASGVGGWATVTGTETHIVTAQRGLTLLGWFKFDSVAGAGWQRLHSKEDAVNRSYALVLTEATDTITFEYFTGAASKTITSVATVGSGVWHFLGARFRPSNDHTIVIDSTILTAGHANASIDDTAAPFEIGRRGNNTQHFAGLASLCVLCACAIPDALFFSFYQQTRAMFGV